MSQADKEIQLSNDIIKIVMDRKEPLDPAGAFKGIAGAVCSLCVNTPEPTVYLQGFIEMLERIEKAGTLDRMVEYAKTISDED